MVVVSLTPRGYCHGVVGAIKEMREILNNKSLPRPIYILGRLVHNEKIVNDFEALGIKTLDGASRVKMLKSIKTGTVIITAHGASQAVYDLAEQKGLRLIDTTCKDVFTSQQTMKDYVAKGYHVIFIGKHTHPESETARSIDNVHVVENVSDIETLNVPTSVVAVTNQTTMSLFDIYPIAEKLREKYPSLTMIEEICDATKKRQQAVYDQPSDVEHCFVVGDKGSNNTNKLKEVSLKAGIEATLIESVEDVDVAMLKSLNKVSVTAGASTPTQLVKEVITFLQQFDPNNPSTHENKSQVLNHNLFESK